MNRKLLLIPLFFALSISFAHQASAMGKKLDLNALQGKYDYMPTSDTSLLCPESITITYNASTASLNSEIFHFSNIGRGSQPAGDGKIETTPDHASYADQSVVTKLTSNSVIEQDIDQNTTSNTSSLPQDPGPLDAPASAVLFHLVDSSSVKTTELKVDKSGIVKQTVSVDGMTIGPNCAYKKSVP